MSSRHLIAGAALALAGALAGCDERGFSGLEAEWTRVRAEGPYHVVRADPDRAVISALGRQVAIEPAEGFCLARESIETGRRSAFALIGDCLLEAGGADGPTDARGALQLPRGVPGIVTVSISGDPGIGDGGDALDRMAAFLETREGRSLLGRSGADADLEVVETRRIGRGIYVMVDEGGNDVVPVLDPRFWRAFVELNERLAVVTVSGFRDRPLGREQMLKYLVNQVQTLEVANAAPIDEAPAIMIASAGEPAAAALAEGAEAPDAASGEVQRLADLEPEQIVIVTRETADPVLWPLPNRRPEELAEGGDGALPGVVSPPPRPGGPAPAGDGEGEAAEPPTANAPASAPPAPRRPSRA